MKRILLTLILLPIISYGQFVFDESTKWDYTQEQIVSNLVMAVNERCYALYRDYSIVPNCENPTNIVHRLYVAPINTQSVVVAWGNSFREQVSTTVFGEIYTNYFVDFEYAEGDEPDGYLWVPRTTFSFFQLFAAMPSSIYTFQQSYDDASNFSNRFGNTKILLKVLNNDYSDPYGVRFLLNKPYLKCDTGYTVFSEGSIMDQIANRTRRLTEYYIDSSSSSLLNTNYPWWKWGAINSGRFYIPPEGARPEEGGWEWDRAWRNVANGIVGRVDGGNWKVPFLSEWLKDDIGQIGITQRYSRVLQYSSQTVKAGVPGWFAGNTSQQSVEVDVPIGRDTPFATANYYKDFYSFQIMPNVPSVFVENDEYVTTTDKYVVSEISYSVIQTGLISRAGSTNLVPYKVYSPQVLNGPEANTWVGDFPASLIMHYPLNDVIGNRYFIKSEYIKKPELENFPPLTARASLARMGEQGIVGNSPIAGNNIYFDQYEGEPIVFYGNYPDGYYNTIFTRVAGGLNFSYSVIGTITTNLPFLVEQLYENPAAIGWSVYHKASLALTNTPRHTSFWDNVSQKWEPNYPENLRHIIYNEKPPLKHLYYFQQSQSEFAFSSTRFSRDFALDLWRVLKKMKKTIAASYAYPAANLENNKAYIGRYTTKNRFFGVYVSRDPTRPFFPNPGPYDYTLFSTNYFGNTKEVANVSDWQNMRNTRIFSGGGYANLYITNTFSISKSTFSQQVAPGLNQGINSKDNNNENQKISVEFLKHPSVSGRLIGYGVEENKTERRVEPYDIISNASRDGTASSPCPIKYSYTTVPALLSRPSKEATDLGVVFSATGGYGIEYVLASIDIPNLSFSILDFSRDDRGTLPRIEGGPFDPVCIAVGYGLLNVYNDESRTYHYDFIWEWDFQYQ